MSRTMSINRHLSQSIVADNCLSADSSHNLLSPTSIDRHLSQSIVAGNVYRYTFHIVLSPTQCLSIETFKDKLKKKFELDMGWYQIDTLLYYCAYVLIHYTCYLQLFSHADKNNDDHTVTPLEWVGKKTAGLLRYMRIYLRIELGRPPVRVEA